MRLLHLVLTGLLLTPAAVFATDEPQEPALPEVKVIVDTSEVPELKAWGEKSAKLIQQWHPKIAEMLKQEGFTPPREVHVVFKKDMDGVAHTIRNQIVIAGNWVKQHPDDTGMVVHELAHVIQAYPRGGPFWLVEGIADYIRFYQYEPNTRLRGINPERQSYRDGYRTSAQFVAWMEKTHPGIVQKINEAIRKREYQNAMIRETTGKSVEQLWDEFVQSEDVKGRR
ncbi:Plant Basic Secretory Protein [Bremerella volcania]|uniref:Plant Basic Secretory Protein n=1 Tax=Bremerella volcania TaxID=2527984 RepID=A0A518C1H0_9BACT|nr:basic secretory protein-like protein [Bremerella volcania]QDU73063.1 Plant Basic Secretory Protein [Bremerella volcania]